jgi:hypothetical protein
MSPPLQDPSPRSSQPLRLFEDFLRALCNAEGGLDLYRMHASSAAVRHGDGVSHAGDIDPAAFATAHREISLQGQDSLPRYDRAALLSVSAEPGTGETVAWFEVAEAREQRNLTVAVGFLTTQGEQHIEWCALAAHAEPGRTATDFYSHSPTIHGCEMARPRLREHCWTQATSGGIGVPR